MWHGGYCILNSLSSGFCFQSTLELCSLFRKHFQGVKQNFASIAQDMLISVVLAIAELITSCSVHHYTLMRAYALMMSKNQIYGSIISFHWQLCHVFHINLQITFTILLFFTSKQHIYVYSSANSSCAFQTVWEEISILHFPFEPIQVVFSFRYFFHVILQF